jgi:protein-tyrosine-phosphatase
MHHTEASPLIRRRLDATIAQLAVEFDGTFSRETVARYVEESFDVLGERPTTGPNFLPLIVDRFARQRLRAVALVEGRAITVMPGALFVCGHNAGRSQMAAALTHHVSNGWIAVHSAGSQPEEHLNPVVVRALKEIGVEVIDEFPKPLTDEIVRAADVVVTMGCGDACPVYRGKHYEDWRIPDPARQPLSVVCTIRDAIRTHVEALVDVLAPLSRGVNGSLG